MEEQKRIKNLEVMFEALKDIYTDIISGYHSINSKKSLGSTNPQLVRQTIAKEEKWLKTAYLNI
jgi:ADP-dependent phosphofructokinase/glucokinase